jgi:tRNA threonylcarbamoyladenosine biosynthesis protein TsaE
MNTFSTEITSEEELRFIVRELLHFAEDRSVFLFEGEMGSGKTTFIKKICEALGVKEGLSSPTYSIVNEYHSDEKKIIYHFDLYRVKNVQECVDLGMEDYLYSGNYCFVEWPEMAEALYPENAVRVRIEAVDGKRKIRFARNDEAF